MSKPLIESLESWEDAEKRMNQVWEAHWSSQKSEFQLQISQPLFRGQANSNWELNTTLDRILKNELISVEQYHFALRKILNEVSSWTEKRWEIDESAKPSVSSFGDYLSFIPQKTYEFMTYLRHHGFPSPLLDWTHSPYVAAFFAFRDIPIDAQTVSIFIYQQNLGEGTITEIGKPYIAVMGPNVFTHYRHYKQQCEYSICIQYEDNDFVYKPHHLVFDLGIQGQDQLLELKIPVSEKKKVMRKLISMNINSISLFESEDGFIQGLGEKAFL